MQLLPLTFYFHWWYPRGTLVFQAGYHPDILVRDFQNTHYKHRENWLQIRVLHAVFFLSFFLSFLSIMSFQNMTTSPKTHLFPPILHVFAPLNDVRAYIAWSWKTTIIVVVVVVVVCLFVCFCFFLTGLISNFKNKTCLPHTSSWHV